MQWENVILIDKCVCECDPVSWLSCFTPFADENCKRRPGAMFKCGRRPSGYCQDTTLCSSRMLDRLAFFFIYIVFIVIIM